MLKVGCGLKLVFSGIWPHGFNSVKGHIPRMVLSRKYFRCLGTTLAYYYVRLKYLNVISVVVNDGDFNSSTRQLSITCGSQGCDTATHIALDLNIIRVQQLDQRFHGSAVQYGYLVAF